MAGGSGGQRETMMGGVVGKEGQWWGEVGGKEGQWGGGGQWKCLGFSLKGGRDAVNLVVHRWKEFVGGRMQSNS